MAREHRFLAFDLGAESGRAILGMVGGDRLGFEELHRFPNGPLRAFGSLYWDPLRLFAEMREGMRLCAQRLAGSRLDGIGVDTWGVDFALLDRAGQLVGYPHHYRDPRTDGVMDAAFEVLSREEIFGCTGIQFMPINTLYQLYGMVRARSPQLEAADRLLMMSGLFLYLMTGRKAEEFTNATTSQLYDPRQRAWAEPLFDALGIPRRIMPEVVDPGTVFAPLESELAAESGLGPAPVLAPACHDTGAAVAAVPAEDGDWAYLSSGTWSLMGVELKAPNLSDDALRFNFTNEGGVGGTWRFLKNIAGLWLVQECRRSWERAGKPLDYAEIAEAAETAPRFRSFIDPDDPPFLSPGDMPEKIQAYCRRTRQPVPDTPGAIARCAFESLALTCRKVLRRIETVLNRRIGVLHIVGGGIRNRLLCRLTASACGIPAIAGPAEATALGNVIVQAMAVDALPSLEAGRALVRRTESLERHDPQDAEAWDDAAERFADITGAET